MSNKGKSILAPESDSESRGSNSGVCNASGLISLKRGRNKLLERDVEDIFFHLVKPKTTLLLGPEVNPIAEVGTSHTLATSTPSEPGPPNLPRPTTYAALQKLENKGTRMVWMNDSLENKLDFLEDATPKKSMKDFIYWRNGSEVRFLC